MILLTEKLEWLNSFFRDECDGVEALRTYCELRDNSLSLPDYFGRSGLDCPGDLADSLDYSVRIIAPFVREKVPSGFIEALEDWEPCERELDGYSCAFSKRELQRIVRSLLNGTLSDDEKEKLEAEFQNVPGYEM